MKFYIYRTARKRSITCFGAVHWRIDRQRLPAVVLLDLKMPKIDGMEVQRQIKGDLH